MSVACENTLSEPVDDSDPADATDATTNDTRGLSGPPPAPTPLLNPEVESERNQMLIAMLAFLRDSCKIAIAQKNRLLALKDKDIVRCKAISAQKNDVLAALEARLTAAYQAVVAVTSEQNEAVSHAATVTEKLERTRAEYDDRIASLTIRIADTETHSVTLQDKVQQQNTQLEEILLENGKGEPSQVRDLYNSRLESCKIRERNDARTIAQRDIKIAEPTKRLESVSCQRAAPASLRYSFYLFMSPRSAE